MPLRICQFEKEGRLQLALYLDDEIAGLKDIYVHYLQQVGEPVDAAPDWENSLDFLPHGPQARLARILNGYYGKLEETERKTLSIPTNSVRLLPPLPVPAKFFLLAGNYAEHIQEAGGKAEEAARTFPYVFWKPPSTTLRGSGAEISLPSLSPDSIDWEVELGVIIGRTAKGVLADQALEYVAGYTVVNDISNRMFRPNSKRRERSKDSFFDWLHGKWFDGFAPVGPCIISADDVTNPQFLNLKLKVNGVTHQDSNTDKMIFRVAEIIEFISSFVTLEPGDLIATGTPAGVGVLKGVFLSSGDEMEAEIEKIGILRTRLVNERGG